MVGLRAGTGAVFLLQRMAERDGGLNLCECTNQNRQGVASRLTKAERG